MFKLPDEVKADVRTYRDSLQRLIAGDISAARFKGVRVPWGVYSQRKNKGNMTRVRFPAGVASGKQLKGIAEAAKRFSNGMLHVTDRQDIQIHNVPLEDTGDLIEFLLEYELSPRGGGGNTVRNITACPRAGICKEEAFDVRGHAIQLTELMLPEPESYTLPRKYKISFSGCGRDCAHATVNDVGFIAKTKAGKKGFTVYVGGGLGSSSRVGRLFEEFLPESDVPYIAEAVKRVFHDHGNRKDKHHARLRFFIEDKGLSEFKRLYIAELDKLRREGSLP
ncbi:MAG: nitrite/sulfite reductase, partial [Candidatus Altiarchaeota archaeon]